MAETIYLTKFRHYSRRHSLGQNVVKSFDDLRPLNNKIMYQNAHGFQEGHTIKLLTVESVTLTTKCSVNNDDNISSITVELKLAHDAAINDGEDLQWPMDNKPGAEFQMPNAYIKEICEDISFEIQNEHLMPRFDRSWEHVETVPYEPDLQDASAFNLTQY